MAADPKPHTPKVERRGLVIHFDGRPTLDLETPWMTRPQDWNPEAAALLFGEAAARRAHEVCCRA